MVLLKCIGIGLVEVSHGLTNEGHKIRKAREGEDVVRAGYGTGKGITKAGWNF